MSDEIDQLLETVKTQLRLIREDNDIKKATQFAKQVHQKQKRKSSGSPYFVHPFRVFQNAKKMGLSKNEQIVALLHDTYEDGDNPREILNQIKKMFGNKIVKYVLLLSHEKSTDYNEYIYNLAKKSDKILNIKLLDMLDNLTDNPTPKQKKKYKNALLYLRDTGIQINRNIQKELYQAAGIKKN